MRENILFKILLLNGVANIPSTIAVCRGTSEQDFLCLLFYSYMWDTSKPAQDIILNGVKNETISKQGYK